MVVVIGEGDKAEMRPVDLGDNYGDSFLLNKGVKAGGTGSDSGKAE